jgi:hypothetical protein
MFGLLAGFGSSAPFTAASGTSSRTAQYRIKLFFANKGKFIGMD